MCVWFGFGTFRDYDHINYCMHGLGAFDTQRFLYSDLTYVARLDSGH